MRILILGGYGFLGQHIAASLCQDGHEVQCTSRKSSLPVSISPWTYAHWDGQSPSQLYPLLAEHSLIINLVGENIAQKRWTPMGKRRILHSRLRSTKALYWALQHMQRECIPLPRYILQASACGYYGLWDSCHTAPICHEESPQAPQPAFLPSVCASVERSLHPLENLGVKTCILRFAPVLGRAWSPPTAGGELEPASYDLHQCAQTALAGLLRHMVPPFKARLGGVLGSGKQPLSWVHIFDLCQSICHVVRQEPHGIYNICSPYPAPMRTFVQELSTCLNVPAFVSVPPFLLRFALGRMADEMLLQGQKCTPQRLLQEGFTFRFTRLASALYDCLCQDDFPSQDMDIHENSTTYTEKNQDHSQKVKSL